MNILSGYALNQEEQFCAVYKLQIIALFSVRDRQTDSSACKNMQKYQQDQYS